MLAALLAASALARPGWGETDFLANLHKAQTRKEPKERVEYLDRAIQAATPEDSEQVLASAYLLRGEARFLENELAAAEPDLSKALQLDARSAQAYLLRGRIRLRNARLKEAERDLREYVGFKSEDLDGWLYLADAQTRGGAFAAALDTLRRAEQLENADWRVAVARARVAMARKDWPRALDELDGADEAAKGQSADARTERAICRFAQGKPEAALVDYDAALPLLEKALDRAAHAKGAAKIGVAEAQEKTARAYFGRGRVNEFLARVGEAGADYREACRLGHQPACEKAKSLPSIAAPARPARREEPREEPRQEEPKPKKRKRVHVDTDAGDRIYAN
jgi:lipopolysaccharide biosynthesis regulator YciM